MGGKRDEEKEEQEEICKSREKSMQRWSVTVL